MNSQKNNPALILLAALAAGILSFSLAQTFFYLNSRPVIDQLFLVLIPAAAIFICLLFMLQHMAYALNGTSLLARGSIFLWAIISTGLLLFVVPFSLFTVFLFILFVLITLPAASSVQALLDAGGIRRISGAWLFASAFSFLCLSFLDDYYRSPVEVILLTALLQAIFGAGGYFFMGRIRRITLERWFDAMIHTGLFLLMSIYIVWLYQTSRGMPLFPASHFTLNPATYAVFLFTTLWALPWQAWLHLRLKFSGFYNHLKSTKVYAYVSENLAGLSLAFGFFILYLIFSSILNEPRFDVDDIFFDADPFNYRLRIASDIWQDYYWRSVHPFVILLFRPPVDLFAFLLKGDRLWGAFIFTALGGASCVYLAWMFIKSTSGNSVYASLIATLLGFSASHLIFGSLIESYIFLAASLLLFFVLLLKDRPLPALIAASLLTVGITHSNFVQNMIALFTVKPNIRQMVRFTTTVIVLLVLLTVVNNLLYPDAHPFFFVPSSLQAEEQNLFPLNQLRVQALMRAFLFHNIAAPTPIFYDQDIPFIQFRFFKPEIDELSQYELPIQNVAAGAWLGSMLLAGVLFLARLKKNSHLRISFALMGCIALNLVLHLRYGKELFLYTPNWTYALVLLWGLAWQPISKNRWFQMLLLAFLFLLAWNNSLLIQTIVDVLASQI